MNILYLILAAIAPLFLVWCGFFLQRLTRAQMGKDHETDAMILRWSRNIVWIGALVLLVVYVNNYVAKIPNPIEPPGVMFDDTPSRERAVNKGPLAVPLTNADPAAGAQRERSLLDDAARQQREHLGSKP